jgi:hypothetical protein
MYENAIKVTVDGPRNPRTRTKQDSHQGEDDEGEDDVPEPPKQQASRSGRGLLRILLFKQPLAIMRGTSLTHFYRAVDFTSSDTATTTSSSRAPQSYAILTLPKLLFLLYSSLSLSLGHFFRSRACSSCRAPVTAVQAVLAQAFRASPHPRARPGCSLAISQMYAHPTPFLGLSALCCVRLA